MRQNFELMGCRLWQAAASRKRPPRLDILGGSSFKVIVSRRLIRPSSFYGQELARNLRYDLTMQGKNANSGECKEISTKKKIIMNQRFKISPE